MFGAIRNVAMATILAVFGAGSSAWAEPIVVAALGDSLTQGYGLPPEDGFVPQLQRWLDAQGATVEVINAGVSGDTTAGGLSRVDWTLTANVDAMIVALGGNDLLRGIDPAVSRANLDGILGVAGARGVPVLLVGMDAPSNYGAAYEEAFDEMYGELARDHSAVLAPNFLGALAAMEDRALVLEQYMQSDAIHPNAEGVGLIVSDLGPFVLELVARVK